METTYEDALQRIQAVGAKLHELAANRDTSHVQIAAILSEYRRACTSALHANYIEATRSNAGGTVEERLWDAHSQINTRFRKDTHELKRRRQNNAVEIRKLGKAYADFLKSSQRFYRAYICELDQYHGGIPELRKAARKLEREEFGDGASRKASSDVNIRDKLVMSCYHSLNHLGDLSRYRETECSTETPKWGPAVGYYNLAIEIYPQSGLSYNQLAVIALADSSHLKAIYYLYRSLAVQEPYPRGQGNLEIEFKKVTSAWDKGELIKHAPSRDGHGSNKALVAWFVRLHSKCYTGQAFAEHRELEDEVLGQLAQAITQPSIEGLLQRLVLTNISAEWFAATRTQGKDTDPQIIKSFQYYFQFNIRTFTTLLQILLEELERPASAGGDKAPAELSDRLTVIARRTLPAIRLYSYWLTDQAVLLSANVTESSLRQLLDELWRVYAAVLTKGVAAFLDQGVPGANYLFEEDSDVVGFLPLVTERTQKHWYSRGELKPRFSDEGVERHHPTKESLIRLKQLVIGGVELLAESKDTNQALRVPLVYENLRFSYQADYDLTKSLGAASQNIETSREPAQEAPGRVAPQQVTVPEAAIPPPQANGRRSRATAPRSSAAKEASMNRMVDALVGDDEGLDALPDEEDNVPVTPPVNYEETPMVRNPSAPLTAGELVEQVQNWGRLKSSVNPSHTPGLQVAGVSPYVNNAPSPRQHPDPWTHPARSGPSSPSQPTSTAFRHSMAGEPRLNQSQHTRGGSAVSLRPLQTDLYSDTISSTRPSTAHTITPTLPRANQLEEMRQVWGVVPNVPTAEWVRKQQPRYGVPESNNMTSSMLFGGGSGPWSADAAKSSVPHPVGWSPRGGQGG